MKNINQPEILYKYMTAETGFKVLESQTIRFSKCFNAPHIPSIENYLQEEMKIRIISISFRLIF